MNESRDNTLRASPVQFVPYALALLGVLAGICAHVALKRHYALYDFSLLSLLWTSLPFLLAAGSTFAVRHFRSALIAVAVVTTLLLFSCLRYTGVTDDDDLPFMLLGFWPALQLFAAIALFTPILAVALFFHQRRTDNPNERIA